MTSVIISKAGATGPAGPAGPATKGAPPNYQVWLDPGNANKATAYNTHLGTTDYTGTTTDAVVASILTALGSTPGTISFSADTHVFAANTTIPTSVGISVPKGGMLSPNTGVNLAHNGPVQAGRYQIIAGAGTVVLNSAMLERVYPEWWGASLTSGDNTASFSKALAVGATVDVAPGTWTFTPTGGAANALTMATAGAIFRGAGRGITKLVLATTSWDLLAVNADHCTVADMTLDTQTNNCQAALVVQANYVRQRGLQVLGGSNTFAVYYPGPAGATPAAPLYNTGNVVEDLVLNDKYAGDGFSWSFQQQSSIRDVVHTGSRLSIYICRDLLVDGYEFTPGTQASAREGYYITPPSTRITIRNFHALGVTAPANGSVVGGGQLGTDATYVLSEVLIEGLILSGTGGAITNVKDCTGVTFRDCVWEGNSYLVLNPVGTGGAGGVDNLRLSGCTLPQLNFGSAVGATGIGRVEITDTVLPAFTPATGQLANAFINPNGTPVGKVTVRGGRWQSTGNPLISNTPVTTFDIRNLDGYALAVAPASGSRYVVYQDSQDNTYRALSNRTGSVVYTGATTDVVLASIVTALAGASASIDFSADTHTLAADPNLPASIGIHVPKGGLLSTNTGITAHLNGPIDAGAYQIFGGAGTVALGAAAIGDGVWSEWWGITGTADDVAINKAITAVNTAGAGRVMLLSKTYNLAASLVPLPYVAIEGTAKDSSNGTKGTVFSVATGVDGIAFGAQTGQATIRRLTLSGGRHGINANNTASAVTFVTIEDVHCTGYTGAGLHLQGNIEEWYVRRLTTSGGNYGLQMENIGTSGSTSYIDKSDFLDCQFSGAALNDISIVEHAGFDLTLQNVTLNTAGQHAMVLDGGMGSYRLVNVNTEGNGSTGKNAQTTGSITSASTSLAVASATGFAASDPITVAGAGSNGGDLTTTISSISGTTFTLAASASTSVASVPVTNASYDEIAINNSVATPTSIAIEGGTFGGTGTNGHLRYFINNSACQNVFVSPSTTVLNNIPSADWAVRGINGPNVNAKIRRGNTHVGDYGVPLYVPSLASDVAGSNDGWGTYPSAPGADAEFVSVSSTKLFSGTFAPTGFIWRKGDLNHTRLLQLQLDGTLQPTRIAPFNGVQPQSSGTTTPDVSTGFVLLTANSGATTITNFLNGTAGQEITLIFNDANTTVQHGTNIFLKSGANFTGAVHTALKLIYTGSVWVEPGGSA